MLRRFLQRFVSTPGRTAAADQRIQDADRKIAEGRRAEDTGDLRAACHCYGEAVALAPTHAAAHLNLGVALEAAGDRDAAMRSYQAVLTIDAGNPYAHYNLGKAYFQQRAFTPAEEHLHTALAAKPEFPEAHVVLSSIHEARGEVADAAAELERALEQRPEYAGAWYNYATLLIKLDRLGDAESAARSAIRFDPGYFAAYGLLGDLLRNDARLEEAVEIFRQARALAGGGLACEQAELHALNYFDGITEQALFERHREVGAHIEAAHPARFAPFRRHADPERRLRVGYVSRDFFRHPVSLFLVPVLERHDRSQVEVCCYATAARADDVTAQVRALSERWVDASRMSLSEVADCIHRDEIDVLVDLLGHAGSSDLGVFAQQPAPVQVTWLGYLNTTGLTRMHYRLCDAVTDPPAAADRLHTETLVRLPHSQWCYRPYREMELSKAHALEPPCERNRFPTFGSFNHRLKLSRTVLDLWARLLAQVPESRLVIMGVPAGPASERLLAGFSDAGIVASRITIVAPLPMNDYFPWFDQVDLALDSTPYSGGTTTCDTLWMGVPVVTLAGARSVSRSAASLLTAVGLAEWIAATPEEYVELAARLARDLNLLSEMRVTLRNRMRASPLMDERGFTRNLEAAYRDMWRAWCASTDGQRVA